MTSTTRYGIGLVLSLGLLSLAAGAQDSANPQGSSLGDYARQARKAGGPASKPKVYDNDNLPASDKLSIVGQASQPDGSTDAKPDASNSGQPTNEGEAKAEEAKGSAIKNPDQGKTQAEEDAAKAEAAKQWADKLQTQKEQIDLLTRELDVLQREYQLRAAAMYADAGNRLRNQGQWDQQDAQYKQQIADKQKALNDAKQQLDDMQESARKAGVPASARE